MKYLLVACALFSLSAAAVIPDDAQAVITHYEYTNDGTGSYRFSFDTSNGIHREEIGSLLNIGKPDEHIIVGGLYRYTDPTGKLVVTKYTADENGYREEAEEDAILDIMPELGLPPSVVATLLG